MRKRLIIRALMVIAVMLTWIFAGCEAPAPPGEPANMEEAVKVSEEPEPAEEPEPCEGFITDALRKDAESGYLILVNKENGLDRDYKPGDLADIKYYAADRSAESRFMRADAAEAFHLLVEEAEKNGITLKMTTAYRSYDFQAAIYESYVARDGREAADRYSARPGNSEHQTGLAADVSSPSVDYGLLTRFAETDEGRWLSENAYMFGFIIRYPKGAEEITGYQFEPWHIRYVGMTAAEYIYENNITLEEYLQLIESEE